LTRDNDHNSVCPAHQWTSRLVTSLLRPLSASLLAAVLLTTAVCQEQAANTPSEIKPAQQLVSRLPASMLAQLSGSLQEVAGKVCPAVVQIEVNGFGPADQTDPKNTALIVHQRGVGSGVIVDPEGYIMTNAHVIAGAQRIRVILSVAPPTFDDVPESGKIQVLDAKVVGSQKEADLALLKVEATNLPTLRFNLERTPQPGELVFAVGSPEGLQNSVTMGVISSVWRQPDPDNPMAYLQTDAPINPGNSGGPLVDVTGQVIGLNTFILSKGGGSEGLGFAIPARVVDFIYRSLKKNGRVDHVEIGVVAQNITRPMAEGLGLPQNWGVVIADVVSRGPADFAGIKPGDVVLAVDGRPILGMPAFAAMLYQHPTDQPVKIDVLRGTEKLSLNVSGTLAPDRISQLADLADPLHGRIEPLGILALTVTPQLLPLVPDLRLGKGVVVVGQAPGFNSVETGLRAGDVIHTLNRKPVDSVEQLKAAVTKLKPGAAAVLRIERQGQFQYLAFEME